MLVITWFQLLMALASLYRPGHVPHYTRPGPVPVRVPVPHLALPAPVPYTAMDRSTTRILAGLTLIWSNNGSKYTKYGQFDDPQPF